MGGNGGRRTTRWKTWQSDSRHPEPQNPDSAHVRPSATTPSINPKRTWSAIVARLLFHRLGSFFAKSRGSPRPASGSLSLTSPPLSIAFVPQSAPVSAEEAPRRRNGSRSFPTLCCASRRRCTAAPAPRCARARPTTAARSIPESVRERFRRFRGDRARSGLNPFASHRVRVRALGPARIVRSRGQPTIPGPIVSLRARARARAPRSPTIVFFFFAREAFGRNRARNKMMPPCACLLQAAPVHPRVPHECRR